MSESALFRCLSSLFFLLLVGGGMLYAQPSIEWQKTFGGSSSDESRVVHPTNDGGYIVAGRTASSDGDLLVNYGGFDIWVLKLSSDGSIQWKKLLGGTGNDNVHAIFQTHDGGYFLGGVTASNDYDVTNNHGGYYDGWAVKLSSSGNIEWQKTFGGSG